MKYNDLVLLRDKLVEIGLINEVENISKFLKMIKPYMIQNILKLSKEDVQAFENDKKVLININFLKSDNYLSDINTLRNNQDKRLILCELFQSSSFLNSKYHNEDLNLIIKCTFPSLLKNLAIDGVSIKNIYHRSDMELLDKYIRKVGFKGYDVSNEYIRYVTHPNSIKSPYHDKDKKTILPAPDGFKAGILCDVAINNSSIESENHESDLSIIRKCDNYAALLKLGQLAVNNKSLASENHKFDMMLLAGYKDEEHLEGLFNVATSKLSIFSEHHISDMNIIANCDKKENIKYLSVLATNDLSIKSKNHEVDMQILFLCPSDCVKKLCTILSNNKLLNYDNRDKIINKLMMQKENISSVLENFIFLLRVLQESDYTNFLDEINKFSARDLQHIIFEYKSSFGKVSNELTNEQKMNIFIKNAQMYHDSNDEIPSNTFKI